MEERQEIRPLEVMVAEVIRETHDTVTLVLFTGNDTLSYRAGHFLTIAPHQFPQLAGLTAYFEHVKGRKEPQRAYSMSSAPHERLLAVTVKEEPYLAGQTPYPPLLSPFLVRGLKAGQRLGVVGFTGPYTLPDDIDSQTDHVVHVCAGSGIVPNFSIIKHALHRGVKARQTLIYGNKSYADVIFREQLESLQREHPGRLEVVHVLSREPNAERHGSSYRTGRVDRALLEEFVGNPKRAVVFTCGPGITSFDRKAARAKGEEPTPRFLETTLANLQAMGVAKDRINYEFVRVSPLRIAVALTILSTVLFGGSYYLWARLVRDTGLQSPWRLLATGALALLGLTLLGSFVLMRSAPRAVASPLAWLGYLWLGLAFLGICAFGALDLIKLLARVVWAEPVDLERRQHLARLASGLVGSAAFGLAAASVRGAEAAALTVKKVRVALRNLDPSMAGLRIVQISDVHVGPTIGREFIEELVRRINELAPDSGGHHRGPRRRDRGSIGRAGGASRGPTNQARHLLLHRQPRVLLGAGRGVVRLPEGAGHPGASQRAGAHRRRAGVRSRGHRRLLREGLRPGKRSGPRQGVGRPGGGSASGAAGPPPQAGR